MRDANQAMRKPSVNIFLEESKFEIPSWNQVYLFLLKLAKAIQNDRFEANLIVGVSRGGWIPARILSDLLENSKLANIKAEFYVDTGKTMCRPIITQSVSVSVRNEKILLVDDVADTGESLKLVYSQLRKKGASEIKIATIYYKPWSVTIPDYYAKETSLWIVFPWEIKETVRKTIEKYSQKRKTVEEIKERLISIGLDMELVERFVKEVIEHER